jgi:iron complex outermembrane receptor protein
MNKLHRAGSCTNPVARSSVVTRSAVAAALGILAPISGPVGAAEERPAGGSTLEEVIVTAQFRRENLQDTPLAITAISAESLQARSLTSVADLGATAPNVNLKVAGAAFGNVTQAFIRGIGQADFNYAFEPGVGMYVDDVYYGTMFGTVFDLLDLDRVEVLRGPQGTLFGKNSIGGAVRLISKQPEGDGRSYLEATYGDFNRIDVRAGTDVTVVPEKLFMRVSAVSKQRDGYQDVIDFACANPGLAGSLPQLSSGPGCKIGTYGGEDVQAARVAFRLTPNDRLEISLTADILQDNSELQADTLLAVDTNQPTIAVLADNGSIVQVPRAQAGAAPAGLVPFWNARVNLPTYGIPWDSRFISSDPYKSYATYTNFNGIQAPKERTVDAWGASGVIQVDITADLQLKSITGYRTYDGNISHDPDQSPLSIQIANSVVGSEQFTQELRLSGQSFADRLDWTAGAFYFDVENTLRGPVILDLFGADGDPNDALAPPVAALRFMQNDRIESTSKSAYLHAIYALTDRWNVFAGYRYTDEEKSYAFDHSGAVGNLPGSGYFSVASPSTVSYTRDDWRLGMDFDVTRDLMVYGQASTGYRSGGVNPRPFSPTQLTTFGPEQATAYEIGAKSSWVDGRVRANVAVFYTDYKDRIVNQQIQDNAGIPFTGPINIGTATVQGAELEIEAVPVDNLSISATYGLIDIELDAQAGSPAGFIDPAGTIPEGSISQGVPERSASAGIQYQIDVGGAGSLTPRLDWSWQSRTYYDNQNTLLASQDGYSLLNARLTWSTPDDGWSVALGVTNLADEEYYVNKFTLLPFGLGTLEGQPARPREWAVTVRRNFN